MASSEAASTSTCPPNDEIRAKTVADIEQNLDVYKMAAMALEQARANEALAKTRLEAAEEAEEWGEEGRGKGGVTGERARATTAQGESFATQTSCVFASPVDIGPRPKSIVLP